MDFKTVYRSWMHQAELIHFEPVTFDNLTIYTTEKIYGLSGAYFFDEKKQINYIDRAGCNDTAYRILLASKDVEKLIAIYIMATIHHIFGRNNIPYHWCGIEIQKKLHEIEMACTDKLGFYAGYHHNSTNVYPIKLDSNMFTCREGYRGDKYFNFNVIYQISALEAMLNSKFAIVYKKNSESLERDLERYYKEG